jgi:CHAT domain-containing protein
MYPEKARRLSQMLLGPVAHLLSNRRLILVKEGALQYLPFDALFVPAAGTSVSTEQSGTYLLETNEVDEVPSMSTLVAIRMEAERVTSPTKVVAVIADPVFSRADERVQSDVSPVVAHAASNQNSPGPVQEPVRSTERGSNPDRLTHTSEEADAISALAPRGTTMVAKGFDATRETAMSSLVGEYQIIHFATHGVLDNEHPELSGIVLSMVDRNGVQKDGLMPLHDIYDLDLTAELIVLSACQTALGKEVKGEGLVGLTHSFMSAGSKSVVASLWKVDDRATSMLMSDFYESMLQKGIPPATALRLAKLKLMKEQRWSAPYHWAGFVFQGDYDNRIAVENRSQFRLGLALVLLVLIAGGLIVLHTRRRRLLTAKRG